MKFRDLLDLPAFKEGPMSTKDMCCDVCGKQLDPMPPEVDAERKAEARRMGLREDELTHLVCDECWSEHGKKIEKNVRDFTRKRS